MTLGDLEYDIMQLKAENLDLKEALLDAVNQACQVEFVNGKCTIEYCSEYQDAIFLLERLGLAQEVSGHIRLYERRWKLVWPERKEVQEPWL